MKPAIHDWLRRSSFKSSWRSALALLLAGAMLEPGALLAQQQPGQPAPPPGPPSARGETRRPSSGGIRIAVLEGQGALNSIQSRTALSPVVQVFDLMENPIEGAEVVFEAPPAGPGGIFSNQKNVISTRTNVRGQASAEFTPNSTPGSFVIKVTAAAGGQSATAQITQTNDPKVLLSGLPPKPTPWFKNWKWWAVIGAGAGAGIGLGLYFRDRNQTATITISPGTIVVGGPR